MAGIRVLMLEDSPADAELTLAALAAAGLDCKADIASGRDEFERRLANGAHDIVIADYNLPGYTGLDALAHVRSSDPLLPFILVSGALGEERAVEALRAGASDFVLKDNPSRLAPAVVRALEEARQRRAHAATQKALELSERRYRAVVEDQSELIIRMLPDLTVTFVNNAYLPLLRARAGGGARPQRAGAVAAGGARAAAAPAVGHLAGLAGPRARFPVR
jgi:DNA-binding NtrC family response regulator